MNYKVIVILLCLSVVCLAKKKSKQNKVQRPRGVALARSAFYDPDKDFTCLDGSGTVPFVWVNDDYCDCADGTDEPGTSACETGQFHCVNLGHSPQDILSSRVNDHVCDCCDGSDEYSGLIQCPNICDELGKQAREEADRMARVQKEGYEKRLELIKEGKKLREDNKKEIEDLKKSRDAMEPERDELDIAKKDAEDLEGAAKKKHEDAWKAEQDAKKAAQEKIKAELAFVDLDTDKDGKISTSEIMQRMEFDKDTDGTVTEEEATEFLGEEQPNLETFVQTTWDNIKDTYKSAVEEEPKDEDAEDVEDFDEAKYMKAGESADDKDEMPPYDDETIQLIDNADVAREAYEKVNKQYTELDTKIKDIDKFLALELGANDEFASMRNKCHNLHDHEYVYTLCLFEKTTQSPKQGGMTVTLGKWGEWSGPPENKYARMKYTGGQNCWNGPDRSTEVYFSCGNEDKLLSASEPARCEYRFEFASPVACIQPDGHPSHTEL